MFVVCPGRHMFCVDEMILVCYCIMMIRHSKSKISLIITSSTHSLSQTHHSPSQTKPPPLLAAFMLEQFTGRGPRTDTINFVWPHSTNELPVDWDSIDLSRCSWRRVRGPLCCCCLASSDDPSTLLFFWLLRVLVPLLWSSAGRANGSKLVDDDDMTGRGT